MPTIDEQIASITKAKTALFLDAPAPVARDIAHAIDGLLVYIADAMPRDETPPEIQSPFRLRAQQARRRRDALTAAGCATYSLGLKGEVPAIVCLCCGLGSVNPHDIAEHFCGFCAIWHSEWRPETEDAPHA